MATPKRVLTALDKRDGRVCSWHGETCGTDTLVPQHRAGGMGGSKFKHRLSNVVWLCSAMNGLIESDADLAREARRRGIKISKFDDPATVPVQHALHGRVFLDDEGGKRDC